MHNRLKQMDYSSGCHSCDKNKKQRLKLAMDHKTEIGKLFGPLSLDFYCNIQVVRLEFGINNTNK